MNLRGTTVVLATHDRDTIQRVGRRVLTLDRGRLVSDTVIAGTEPPELEPPAELEPPPELDRTLDGEPPAELERPAGEPEPSPEMDRAPETDRAPGEPSPVDREPPTAVPP